MHWIRGKEVLSEQSDSLKRIILVIPVHLNPKVQKPVYEILGKQVMTLTPNASEVKIDAYTLSKGLYFAKISTDNGSSSLKLIKN